MRTISEMYEASLQLSQCGLVKTINKPKQGTLTEDKSYDKQEEDPKPMCDSQALKHLVLVPNIGINRVFHGLLLGHDTQVLVKMYVFHHFSNSCSLVKSV